MNDDEAMEWFVKFIGRAILKQIKAFFTRHWNHGKYVFKHKWFVFLEACKLGIPLRGLVHDWHRFLPLEWIPYSNKFKYGPQTGRDKSGHYDPFTTGIPGFAEAWFYHQKFAFHHWQSYCCPQWNGEGKGFSIRVFEMPYNACKEMLADMRGAARAQGTGTAKGYYEANKDKILLGVQTRAWLEYELGIIDRDKYLQTITGNPNIKSSYILKFSTQVEVT